ncbi:MAG: VWA domain-containing protein [Anaerolineales bacterium]|nr:VWA domain-containing protein [Anaerolineales bacterium]
MAHKALATSRTPALIIYLLDVSASMEDELNGRPRIDIVMDCLSAALQQMVFRSTKGGQVSPRYRIAIFAYSDDVYDILDGVRTIDEVASLGMPELGTLRGTDTAKGFLEVEKLLKQELPHIGDSPAPLVCHMTDGEYTDDDPEPIVRRIMDMACADGRVLVENIFISDDILDEDIDDPTEWRGVTSGSELSNPYAEKLRALSSKLPESYQTIMRESGYSLEKDALMLLPGQSAELIEMGFVMSGATPTA